MDKPKLLIIEDNEDLRTQMRWALAQDYQVFLAEDRAQALDTYRLEQPALVTLDLGLPPEANGVEEGFRTLGEILGSNSGAKVIVITGREEREHALRAVGQGAHDLFHKPIDIEELKLTLRRAHHVDQLEREYRELQRQVGSDSFEGMLGTCPPMQEVFAVVRKVAPSDVPVLVLGESGSGKELVARALHSRSHRRDGPFVVINCGAIPATLLESELFGHERGAFTGAHIQRKGRIEAAHGGTLFLDEIGELTLPLQVTLLRFLQEHCLERVGGREQIEVDARVVAATNVDLKQAIRTGTFREDLYYRLGVVNIVLPPLRERGADVELIARAQLGRAQLGRAAAGSRKAVDGFTGAALQALAAHAWPGNVRELENRIRRAVIMAEGSKITARDLELAEVAPRPAPARALRRARAELEKEMVEQTLARHGGNVSRTAAELGVSRPTLYSLMDKLGIRRG